MHGLNERPNGLKFRVVGCFSNHHHCIHQILFVSHRFDLLYQGTSFHGRTKIPGTSMLRHHRKVAGTLESATPQKAEQVCTNVLKILDMTDLAHAVGAAHNLTRDEEVTAALEVLQLPTERVYVPHVSDADLIRLKLKMEQGEGIEARRAPCRSESSGLSLRKGSSSELHTL